MRDSSNRIRSKIIPENAKEIDTHNNNGESTVFHYAR